MNGAAVQEAARKVEGDGGIGSSGASRDTLGILFGTLWGSLGPTSGSLGALACRLGRVIGRLGGLLGASWAVVLERAGRPLEG